MFTKAFWKDTAERAFKSAAQALLLVWVVVDGVFNVWTVDWNESLGIALGAAAISVLTSLTTGALTKSGTASATREVEYLQ